MYSNIMPKHIGKNEQTLERGRAVQAYTKKKYTPKPRDQAVGRTDGSARSTNVFPAQQYYVDDYDDTMDTKAGYLKAMETAGMDVKRTMNVDREEIDWIERKRAEQEELAFNDWIVQNVKFDSPAEVALARQNGLLQDYYTSREKEIEYLGENAIRLAKIQLKGKEGRNLEDMRFLYEVQRGNIRLPGGNLWDPSTYSKSTDTDYQRGLFNIKRFNGLRAPTSSAARFDNLAPLGSATRTQYTTSRDNVFNVTPVVNTAQVLPPL